MGRPTSLNWEWLIGGKTVKHKSHTEFANGGEEGELDVYDGDQKYQIGNQIFATEKMDVVILVKDDKEDLQVMEDFCKTYASQDIFLIGRDVNGVEKRRILFQASTCKAGKNSKFDRASKEADTKTYSIMCKKSLEM